MQFCTYYILLFYVENPRESSEKIIRMKKIVDVLGHPGGSVT